MKIYLIQIKEKDKTIPLAVTQDKNVADSHIEVLMKAGVKHIERVEVVDLDDKLECLHDEGWTWTYWGYVCNKCGATGGWSNGNWNTNWGFFEYVPITSGTIQYTVQEQSRIEGRDPGTVGTTEDKNNS